MTTADQTVERIEPRAAERSRLPRPSFKGDWWRHLIALIAVGIALFPIAYVASAAFNADSSLGGASLIPRDVTLDNFRELLCPTRRRASSSRRPRTTSPGSATRS